MSELLTPYERSILKDSINAKYGCDPECANRNPDNKQFKYRICIVYSSILYSLDAVIRFIDTFKTVSNTRYGTIFTSRDICIYDGAKPNQKVIKIKGFHSRAHASDYIKILDDLKDTFDDDTIEYDTINVEPYEIVYNNTYDSTPEITVDADEELEYLNHELTMGEVLDKEIAEHPEELADLKAAIFPDNDNVNHPGHYIQDGIETIDVIKAWTKGLDGIIATDTGNVIKYIARWNKKNGIEDLKKAQWYLNHLIKEMEERMENDCCC